MTLNKMIKLLKTYLKMNDLDRLDKINKIREYFDSEINERQKLIKGLNKYIVGFDYFDKIFITLSATSGTLSIASHDTIVGILAGIAGASLTLIFTIRTGVNKSLLQLAKKTQ